MSSKEIHIGSIGHIFDLTIYDENDNIVDISSATTTKNIIFCKTDGTIVVKNASFKTDGTDGIMSYTTVSGDIDQSGMWKIQGYVVLATGSWYTDIKNINIFKNLTTI